MGEDALIFKLSADGVDFLEAAHFNADTGRVSFKYGLEHTAMAQPTTQILPTPGGDGAVSLFRLESDHSENPRTFTLSGVTGDILRLSAVHTCKIFDAPERKAYQW